MVRGLLIMGWMWVAACAPPQDDIALKFRAWFGDRPLACGQSYVGAGGARLRFDDVRLYVSDLTLLDEDGRQVPLTLRPDTPAQNLRTALLDFTPSPRTCAGGSPQLARTVHGRAPRGRYRGLALTVGLPFEDNHQDVSVARAPLDVSSMFWVWRSGYKFVRIDGTGEADGHSQPFSVHVGSTGCDGRAPTDRPTRCTHPNRARVRLGPFDAARDHLAVQLDALLRELVLTGTSPGNGCESDPDDLECRGVFDALGLTGHEQTFVKVGRGP